MNAEFLPGAISAAVIIGTPVIAYQLWIRRHRPGTLEPVRFVDDARRTRIYVHTRSGARVPLVELTQEELQRIVASHPTFSMDVIVLIVQASWQCYPPATTQFIYTHFTASEREEIAKVVLDLSGWVGWQPERTPWDSDAAST